MFSRRLVSLVIWGLIEANGDDCRLVSGILVAKRVFGSSSVVLPWTFAHGTFLLEND